MAAVAHVGDGPFTVEGHDVPVVGGPRGVLGEVDGVRHAAYEPDLRRLSITDKAGVGV